MSSTSTNTNFPFGGPNPSTSTYDNYERPGDKVARAEGRLSALIVMRGKIKKSLADPSESANMDEERKALGV